MTDHDVFQLAVVYRKAIEAARDDDRFVGDSSFAMFPRRCCGDTSCLLAEYLLSKGVNTVWCSGWRNDYSHAWLVVSDMRIRKPIPSSFCWPEEICPVVKRYGVTNPEIPIDNTHYEAEDIERGLLIDITGDQFDDSVLNSYEKQNVQFLLSHE